MAAMPSLQHIFTIPYKGSAKTWSMKYHFSGGVPPDFAHWNALDVAVFGVLKEGLRTDVEFTGSRGYVNDASPAVYSTEHGTPGLIDASDEMAQAAYVAALLSWTTDQRNSRGGPIFLRNFVHGVVTRGGALDEVQATQLAALSAFAAQWSDAGAGFSDGSTTYHRAGPNGAVGLTGTCRDFVSHRVLARRG